MTLEHLYPEGLRRPPTYTPVVRATGGTTLYLSGQVPVDGEGNLVDPNEFAGQAKQVFENLRLALAGGGATFADLVRMTTYIVGFNEERRAAFSAARIAAMGDAVCASTLLGVATLAQPGFQIEVEGIAVVATAR